MSWSNTVLRAARAACSHQPAVSAALRSASSRVASQTIQGAASAATVSGFTTSAVSQLQRSMRLSASTFASSRFAAQMGSPPQPHFDAPSIPSIASAQATTADGSVSHAGGSSTELAESADEGESNKGKPHCGGRPKRPPDKLGATFFDGVDENDERFVAGSVQGDPNNVYILSRGERRQGRLAPADSSWLWRRAEALAADGKLVRVRVGKAGPTPQLLAAIGDALEAHELVRVTLSPGQDPSFLSWLIEASQDCVTVRVKGRTLTLFRDASLDRPAATRLDGMVAAAARGGPPEASHSRTRTAPAAAAAAAAPVATSVAGKAGGVQLASQHAMALAAVHRHTQPAWQPPAAEPRQAAEAGMDPEAHKAAGKAQRQGILRHLWMSRAHTFTAKLKVTRRIAAATR